MPVSAPTPVEPDQASPARRRVRSVMTAVFWGGAGLLLATTLMGGGEDTPDDAHGPHATRTVAAAPSADASTGPAEGGSAASPAPAERSPGKHLPRSAPTRLVIPSIGVNAPFTTLDLNSEGQLEAPPPNDTNLVGWYAKGASRANRARRSSRGTWTPRPPRPSSRASANWRRATASRCGAPTAPGPRSSSTRRKPSPRTTSRTSACTPTPRRAGPAHHVRRRLRPRGQGLHREPGGLRPPRLTPRSTTNGCPEGEDPPGSPPSRRGALRAVQQEHRRVGVGPRPRAREAQRHRARRRDRRGVRAACTLTSAPLCVTVPPHRLVIRWPVGKVQRSVHPSTAVLPVLRTTTSPWKPPGHSPVTR